MKQRRKVIKNQKTVLDQSVIDSAMWGDRGRLALEEAESRLLNAQQFSHNRRESGEILHRSLRRDYSNLVIKFIYLG